MAQDDLLPPACAFATSVLAERHWDNVLVTSTKVLPIILGIQQDGSISIVG
jgi:hypothetical protein